MMSISARESIGSASRRIGWAILSGLLLSARLLNAQQQSELAKTYVVVTDRTSNQILRFDTSGNFKDSFVGPSPLSSASPEAVVFGPDQNLYISRLRNGTVERYNGATGNYISNFGSLLGAPLQYPEDLTFGPDGNIYVVDRGRSAVLRFDGANQNFIDYFVAPGSGGYNNAGGLTFGPDGDLYVTSGTPDTVFQILSPQVLRFDGHTGAFKGIFVATSNGGLNAPARLIFGPDGNLYVSSVLTNNVLRYNGKTGAFIDAFVPSGSGGLSYPFGLTFGPDGNLYVCSSTQIPPAILRFNGKTGAFIDTFIVPGNSGMRGPTGVLFYTFESQIVPRGHDTAVATDRVGNRMVAWTDNDQINVESFDPSGKSTGPAHTISAATDVASNPKIIATGTNSFVLAWQATPLATNPSATSASGARIILQPLPGTGTPTVPPQQISTAPSNGSDGNPTITPVRLKVVALWARNDSLGRGTGIVGRVVDATNATPLSGEIPVSTATTDSSDEAPTAASDSDNRVVLAWRRRRLDGSATSILAAGTDSTLAPISPQVIDNGSSGVPGNPSISSNTQGQAMLTWVQTTGSGKGALSASNARVVLIPIGMDGHAAGGPVTVNADPSRGATTPQVSIGESGIGGVVWQYNGLGGVGTGIYGRTVDASGVVDKTDFVVSDAAKSSEAFFSPAVAMDASGTMTISSHKIVSGASNGVFTRTRAVPGASGCTPDSRTACLLNSRFKATVRYRGAFDDATPDTDALVKQVTGFANANFETSFFYFNDSNNIEVVLKMLDQGNTDAQGHLTFAVLFGTATPLRIQVTLTDTQSGVSKSYESRFGKMQGATDFTAFIKALNPSGSPSATWEAPRVELASFGGGAADSATCAPDIHTACLLNGRFKATVRYRAVFDNAPAGSDAFVKSVSGFANSNFETAFFYFNDANNIELLLKMLDQGNRDAQGNRTIALLFGTATPLRIELTITDTRTGATRTYMSEFGSMQGATDFTAFPAQ